VTVGLRKWPVMVDHLRFGFSSPFSAFYANPVLSLPPLPLFYTGSLALQNDRLRIRACEVEVHDCPYPASPCLADLPFRRSWCSALSHNPGPLSRSLPPKPNFLTLVTRYPLFASHAVHLVRSMPGCSKPCVTRIVHTLTATHPMHPSRRPI
jgi:hypothetical protein